VVFLYNLAIALASYIGTTRRSQGTLCGCLCNVILASHDHFDDCVLTERKVRNQEVGIKPENNCLYGSRPWGQTRGSPSSIVRMGAGHRDKLEEDPRVWCS
jgi:hypothetical protein